MAQTTEDTTPVKLGISVATSSPELDLPTHLLESLSENGWEHEDAQELGEKIDDWWESLTVEERADALNIDEKKGWEIVEDLLFVDDTSGEHTEVVWEN